MNKTVIQILMMLSFFSLSFAQMQEYNHPELKWFTIETDHFYVHYHNGTERTARLTAKIAEDIYGPITSLYQYEPDGKIHFIVRDHDDNSNGAAFYYDQKVEIWAPAMDFPFRGTHNWLRNVITHEFSHMISLGAIRKMPRQLQAVYLQWMDYEKETRKDVIHGYPNKLVSVPLPGTVVPIWFAEGMAQFQRANLDYEKWDTHRDMLLRTAVTENRLQSLAEMSMFGKTSLRNEGGAYNQGYGLTLYFAHQYGEETIPKLVQAMTQKTRMSFSGATKEVLNLSDQQLYDQWKTWLDSSYAHHLKPIQEHAVEGKIIDGEGLGNFYAAWSPDGKTVAYLSSRGKDYISLSRLWIYNVETGKRSKLTSGVQTTVSWSPDGKKLVYAKDEDRNKYGSLYLDLYQYDLDSKKETRLTRFKRARYPTWSGDGNRLACVIEEDGTSNLYTCAPDGKQLKAITQFDQGQQIFSPRWIPGTDQIVFALSGKTHGRDLAVIDSTGQQFSCLLQTDADERDPYPTPDGQAIYYASDQTGIFNVYQLNLADSSSQLVTNVTGGVFMPAVNDSGNLVFTTFKSDGYKLALLEQVTPLETENARYESPYASLKYRSQPQPFSIHDYDDSHVPELAAQPYQTQYGSMMFLPRIMMDYPNKPKLGTYFYSSDFLDKISLFGGVAANTQKDADVFAMFNYNQFKPSLFLEAFYQKRHTKDDDMNVIFDLMEVDMGADWRLGDGLTLRTAYVFDKYSAGMRYQDQGINLSYDYTYHIGNAIQLLWNYEMVPPTLISGIAPDAGMRISFEIRRAWNRFLDDFEVHPTYGTLVETYTDHNYTQYMLDSRYYTKSVFKDHSMKLRVRVGVLDNAVDSFYNFYAGGLDGMRGYPFYSIEGRKLAQLGLAYRFPLIQNMALALPIMTLDDLFLSVYGDYGNAWSKKDVDWNDWKKDVGVQVRLSTYVFYGYPMKIFWDACYGLDGFTHKHTQYGEAWRYYFGILFDFLE